MSHYRFEKLLDREINHKGMFVRARRANEEENENVFIRRRIKQKIELADELKTTIFEKFQELNCLKKYRTDLDNDYENEGVWNLIKPKIQSCKKVAEELNLQFGFIYRNFPDNIVSCKNPREECDDCAFRDSLLDKLEANYGHDYSQKDDAQYVFTEEEIEADLMKIRGPHRRWRRMTENQKKRFHEYQEVFQVLEEHHSNLKNSNSHWHHKLVDDNIAENEVVCIPDHMGGVPLGKPTKNKRLKKNTNTVRPFGITFCYRDPETGKTERIYRLVVPDTISLTAWQVIQCLKKMCDIGDPRLQSILERKTHFIVTNFDFPSVEIKIILTLIFNLNSQFTKMQSTPLEFHK